MIKHQIRTADRTVLRRIHGSGESGRKDKSDPIEEIVGLLSQLPRVNGMGQYSLDLVSRLTASDIGKVVHQLKRINPGLAGVIKDLGYWFPKDDKHHIRHALVCAIGAVAASFEPIKLHRLE